MELELDLKVMSWLLVLSLLLLLWCFGDGVLGMRFA